MTVVSFLTLIFAIFRIVARVIWLVLAPGTVTRNVFRILTGFVFRSLRPPVLLSLLHLHRRFISGIIVWVIFVHLDYLICFIEVF
jgi:hypothetical protein